MVIDEKLQRLKLLVRNFKLYVTMHFNFEIIDLEKCMKLKCIMPFTNACSNANQTPHSLSLSFGLTFYVFEKKDAL